MNGKRHKKCIHYYNSLCMLNVVSPNLCVEETMEWEGCEDYEEDMDYEEYDYKE